MRKKKKKVIHDDNAPVLKKRLPAKLKLTLQSQPTSKASLDSKPANILHSTSAGCGNYEGEDRTGCKAEIQRDAKAGGAPS